MQKKYYLCSRILCEYKNQYKMKRISFVVLSVAMAMSVAAQKQNQTYLDYIEEWKNTAILQQEEYGIPASITMAQALLESAAGQSELARNAKNHFGIKCTSEWFGGVYYYDDDKKDECFRQYANAAESFKDHSRFLQRPRYSTCFEIAVEDYEGWAFRLRECGYATDKHYASKLIRLIEDYRLDTLGKGAAVGAYDPDGEQDIVAMEPTAESPKAEQQPVPQDRQLPPDNQKPKKAVVVHRNEPIMVIKNDPEPEYAAPKSARQERDSFLLMHPKKRFNGVNYVEAREGDTYANVAFRLNVRERDLREYNDALGRDLAVGDRIYMAPKKSAGTKDYVWSYTGLSLWKLSQDEGVTIESIQKLNGLDQTVRVFRTRQKIYLKKVKDDGVR